MPENMTPFGADVNRYCGHIVYKPVDRALQQCMRATPFTPRGRQASAVREARGHGGGRLCCHDRGYDEASRPRRGFRQRFRKTTKRGRQLPVAWDERSLGQILNDGLHAVDLLLWIFGAEAETVSSPRRGFRQRPGLKTPRVR